MVGGYYKLPHNCYRITVFKRRTVVGVLITRLSFLEKYEKKTEYHQELSGEEAQDRVKWRCVIRNIDTT